MDEVIKKELIKKVIETVNTFGDKLNQISISEAVKYINDKVSEMNTEFNSKGLPEFDIDVEYNYISDSVRVYFQKIIFQNGLSYTLKEWLHPSSYEELHNLGII